ncbi:MAG: Mfa1 fimbrilin C-terminal domain-containing protein [Bacteroides sp.]|nr:Mfa1 fimbrilin C-terminal domain-containing protein [Bacteroides sp.]
MKIKNLLLGMLASLAFVSCANDEILEEVNTPQQSEIENSDAYLTFSIVQGASTRALDGESTGDNHGDAENSGHESTGTANEANVKEVMVVFYNTDENSNDGFCGTISVGTEITNDNGVYAPSAPFLVNTTGEYKLAVVLNPCASLKSLTADNRAAALEHYNTVINGEYEGDANGLIGANKDAFMMTNKAEVSINVTATNNESSPATPDAAIEVERAVAKMTYRTIYENNIYDITAKQYSYELNHIAAWVKAENGSYTYYADGFYPAHSGEKELNARTHFYVAIINGTTQYFIQEADENGVLLDYTGEINGENGPEAKTAKSLVAYTLKEGSLIVYEGQQSDSNPVEVSYKVQLTDYALFNLNNKSYYVRHTSKTPEDVESAQPFGQLINGNYLMEPNTAAKSAFVWENNTWTTNFNGETYFGATAWGSIKNTLEAITWTELPTGEGEAVDTAHDNYSTTGALLGYVLENSVTADNQVMDMTTGIVFKAKMMDADGKELPLMLRYEGGFYKDLESLNAAFGANSPLKDFATEQYGVTIFKDDLETLGVDVYENGDCYYIAAQIKHFDNNDNNSLGVNEYIKMRNNIYSVAVTGVEGFGFSENSIQDIEEVEDGTSESIYLTLSAEILPWIVRYTNVEF